MIRGEQGVALTDGERRAYRVGYVAALADLEQHASDRRIRIAARSEPLEAPERWPLKHAIAEKRRARGGK